MPWDKAFTSQALEQLFNNSLLILKISSLFSLLLKKSFRYMVKIYLISLTGRYYTGNPSA